MKPQYLLRFDDLCPTMNWDIWVQIEKILLEFEVKPILAVVPDNQDEKLKVCEPNKGFWDEVRTWQSRSWTIGLHGYQHLFLTHDAGIVGINPFSEFSGLSLEEQSYKMHRAQEIFEREKVKTDVWVAPAHSFDETTVKALRSAGIKHISDGLHFFPHLDSLGILWVPQQFWRFRWMPLGIWTVCHHFNSWTGHDIAEFRSDLQRFRPAIVDFSSVVASYSNRRDNWFDRVCAKLYLTALRTSQMASLKSVRSSF
ncbi:MAG TPA: DUF2334 domain-containing protein [Candidatus Acidoferrum sp.]|nr:DUF2334 domain-containing protein [Candidatus Acidoferrum sp.]